MDDNHSHVGVEGKGGICESGHARHIPRRLREAESVDTAACAVHAARELDGRRKLRVERTAVHSRQSRGSAGAASLCRRHEADDFARSEGVAAGKGDHVRLAVQNRDRVGRLRLAVVKVE